MKKFTFNDINQAMATWNANPFCVEEEAVCDEVLNELNENRVTENTPDDTNPDEWEHMLAILDLSEKNNVRRILTTQSLTICLPQDFDYLE